MNKIFESPIFFIAMTTGLYYIFSYLYQKTKFALLNPLLLTAATIIIYLILSCTNISTYNNSLSIFNYLLGPLTVCLAIPIYTRKHIIKQYKILIIIGTIVGTITSIGSIFILGYLFQLDNAVIMSMVPKSVTTPIALEISNRLGGIKEITVFVVVLTGIFGSLFGPVILKLLKINQEPAIGMAFGITSHAVGTSKAVEININAGAIAGIAIVSSGLLTTLITLFF